MEYNVSLIIPFLNERENLERIGEELSKYISRLNDIKVEVIFIDDGSTDGSTESLQKLNHKNYSAKVVKFSRNYGSHAAIRAGILHSKGEYITSISADLQDPIEIIEKLYDKCKEGYDVAWAVRKNIDVGIIEKIFSGLYAKLVRKFINPDFPAKGLDVVMFNRKIQDELNQNIEANSSLFLQIFTSGFKQGYVPYDRGSRKTGKSKWTLSKKIKLATDSFMAFSYAPLRFITLSGIIMLAAGILGLVYKILKCIIFNCSFLGHGALIVVLVIGFGATNISLGIVAEYLWRTYEAARKRKVFVIDGIIELK